VRIQNAIGGLLLAAVASAQEAGPTPSPTPTPAPAPPVSLHGFVDVYYAYNSNRPGNHQNFVSGTGSTAEHGNDLGVNLAAVTLSHAPDPVGFTVTLNAGSGTDVIHSGEPANGRDVYRAIYQASAVYENRPGGLRIEAGVFPCHVGFEGFFSKDNWNYTRSWLGEFSPYYSAGVKVEFPLSNHLRTQIHVLNGWQLIRDNNDSKTVGTQLLWTSERVTAAVNTLYGAELPGDDASKRAFGDSWVSFQVTPALAVAASFDAGRQAHSGLAAAIWWGVAAYARYSFTPSTALTIRVERFDDPDGGITAEGRRFREATLTVEHRPHPNLIVKLEGRLDRAEDPVFRRRERQDDSQLLAILGIVGLF
jgi:Putative beta-barrel porin-2, OmpL-like. bbp2